jgi:hypothetical protein
MPGPIAHFVTFIETYHEFTGKNVEIFEAVPGKGKRLVEETPNLLGKGKTDEGISQYAYLGSVFPDIPYFDPDKAMDYAADLFHYNKSGTFAIKLIDHAKEKKDDESRNTLMAFALGFISHIACDVVCHPYVNTIAGAYWNQLMPFIGKNAKGDPVNMHMMTEVHQDSWLASSYFGLKSLSSEPLTKSWSGFLEDIFGVTTRPEKTTKLLGDIRSCFKEVYNMELAKEEPLADAGDVFFNALDIGYDQAWFPVPDLPSKNLVDYEFGNNSYWWYIEKAFALSKALCKKAIKYYEGEIDRKMLKESLKDWNLDTGYCINVETKKENNKIESIHIKYEHNWCHNYGLY